MIKALNVSKKFNDVFAVNNISLSIKEGNIFGILGTNGSGKSTFLRMMSGILKPDKGSLTLYDKEIFENVDLKKDIFYVSDEQFFFQNSTPEDMKNFYKSLYRNFDVKRYDHFLESFNLHKNRKINTFSKGMKKQVSAFLGICSNTKYLLCDETFDGVDSFVRKSLKSIFAQDMEDRNLTTIIASHNIREIEDICGNITLFHKGEILLSKDIDDLRVDFHKVQVVFNGDAPKNLWENLKVIKHEVRGSLNLFALKGDGKKIEDYLRSLSPVFLEIIPLSLEEIFIVETEDRGHGIKEFVF